MEKQVLLSCRDLDFSCHIMSAPFRVRQKLK